MHVHFYGEPNEMHDVQGSLNRPVAGRIATGYFERSLCSSLEGLLTALTAYSGRRCPTVHKRFSA